jgi:sugar lactone lactonase YvrE
VLHCGNSVNEIVILELPAGRLLARAAVEESFYGLTFSPDGSRLFCSGAGKEVVHAFGFKDGYLGPHEEIPVHEVKERGIPSGMTCSADGRTLYVASVWDTRLVLSISKPRPWPRCPGHQRPAQHAAGTAASR